MAEAPPVSIILFPVRVNALALASKVREENDVFEAKSLLDVVRELPVKIKASPAEGAMSLSQFAAVCQLLSDPPPSQVLVAAFVWMYDSNNKIENIDRRFMSVRVVLTTQRQINCQ
jgi:hypothetical protein